MGGGREIYDNPLGASRVGNIVLVGDQNWRERMEATIARGGGEDQFVKSLLNNPDLWGSEEDYRQACSYFGTEE